MKPLASNTVAAFADGLLESVLLVEPVELRIEFCNQAAVTLLGMDRQALIGRLITDVLRTPEDAAFWAEALSGVATSLRSHTQVAHQTGGVIQVLRQVQRFPSVTSEVLPDMPPPPCGWLVSLVDMTEHRRMEDELELVVSELRATLDSTADGMLVCALDGSIRGFNRRFAQLWDVPKDLLMRRDDSAVHALLQAGVIDGAAYARQLEKIFSDSEADVTDTLVLRNGRLLQRHALPQVSRGRVIGRVFSFHDITVQFTAEEGLRLAAKVFDACPDAIFIADIAHRIVSLNPAAVVLTRTSAGELTGSSAIDLFQNPDSDRWFTEVEKAWKASGLWEGEVWHRRSDGSTCPVRLSWVVLPGAKEHETQSVGFFQDLTSQRASQQRIEELAYSDVLTGLPNRFLFARRVGRALRNAGSGTAVPFAVLFVDLDRFKNINDALGHHFGDRVLVKIAERLGSCLRLADTLCRLGGDEFVIHLHESDMRSAEAVARHIIKALAQPIQLDEMKFSFGCSIGVALYPLDGDTLDDLVRHADTAMFKVKQHGRGSYRFYQPSMNVNSLSRVRMEHALRDAIERRQFRLHYQPQIDMASGELVGVEALIRWTDPGLGEVSPGVFIPLAEESGAIIAVGAWVLEEGVRQAAAWAAAGTPLPVSINVSALQFRQADFVDRVAAAIRMSGLPAYLLELELTESILVQEVDEALQRLDALAALGVRLAIDDFGTGYSSLGYLKRFPIHRLKIDQSFVRGLPDDLSDRAIVRAMTSLAAALGFDVVAEGVETAAQRDCLIDLGCGRFQGFLCAPALPAESLTRRMQIRPFYQAKMSLNALPMEAEKKVSADIAGPAS